MHLRRPPDRRQSRVPPVNHERHQQRRRVTHVIEQVIEPDRFWWGRRRGAAGPRLWRNAREEFMPFLDYDVEIRKVLCSTNAIGFHIRWKRKRGTNKWYVPRQRRDLTYSSRSTLAGPTPSGSADAPRLCRGCSHPHRHLPGQAAPSFRGLPRQPTGAGISPPLNSSASGARNPP
jgi:hypothetical protein